MEWHMVRQNLCRLSSRALSFHSLHGASRWLAFAILVVGSAKAAAQAPTNTWTATATGNWSTSGNWTPVAVPASNAATTVLQFNASGSTSYTATNDLGAFSLFGINLNSTSSNPITLADTGTGITFASATTTGFINQNGSGAVVINNPMTFLNTSTVNDVAVGGFGTGTVTLNGVLSGAGGIGVMSVGSGTTVVLTNPGNSFGTAGLVGGAYVGNPGGTLLVTAPSGTPFGSAGVEISAGVIDLAPSGSGANVSISLNSASTASNFTCNAGGTLVLDKGSNTSLTFNIRAIARTIGTGSSGNLAIAPGSGIANLGTSTGESLIATNPQANVNGIVVPVLVGQASKTDSTGDFLTYYASATVVGGVTYTGFARFPSYTNYSTSGGAFSSSTAGTEISNVTAATTASAAATIAALRVSNATLTIASGNTVSITGGAFTTTYNQAGLILNNATISSGTLSIPLAGTLPVETDVYVAAGTSTINSQLVTSNTGGVTPSLVKFGPGNLMLTNVNNSFTAGGVFSLYSGNLTIVGPGGTNDATVLGTGALSMVMRGGGFEVMNGNYAPPTGTKTFTIGTAGGTFQIDDTSVMTLGFASQLAPVAGSGPLYKTGTGTLVLGFGYGLGGLSNIIVNGGQLQVNAATSGASPVQVNSSATLAGTGAVSGVVTVASGATIAPGLATTIATLATGGEVFQGGGNYTFKYNPGTTHPTAGADNDTLSSAAGTLDMSQLSLANPLNVNLVPQLTGTSAGIPVTYDAASFSSYVLPAGVSAANVNSLFSFTGKFAGTASASLDTTHDQLLFTFIPSSQTQWTGSASGNWSNGANWSPTGAPASNANTQLLFGATTNATMNNDISGTLTLNSLAFSAGAPAYSLTGNGLNFVTSGNGILPQIAVNSTTGVNIGVAVTLANNMTVTGAGNATISGPIGGTGSMTYAGTGTLTLSNAANNYSGGTTVQSGTLQVGADSALGGGNATVAALGTLAFSASTTTTRSFTINGGSLSAPAGVVVTFNGANVAGGYLAGSGFFATNGANGAYLAGLTIRAATTIYSNSSADQILNVTNNGTLNIGVADANNAGGNIHITTPVAISNLTNQGTMTIGANVPVNVVGAQSYGTLNIANGTTVRTLLTNTGTSPLFFDGGSRTFIGTAGGNGLAQLELNGNNAIVANGLLVNNGHVTDSSALGISTIVADYGSLVKGAGLYDNPVRTINGGRFQSGNSPGVATFGSFVFGPGGVTNYVEAINDATGTAGPMPNAAGQVSGWGLIKTGQWQRASGMTSGGFDWTATSANPVTVSIETLVNPTAVGTDVPGLMADFDPTRAYSWLAANWVGSYSGPTDAASLDAATSFDTTGFQNPIAGTFGWNIDPTAGTLSLTYTPSAVPEPGTFALVGAAIALGWRRIRVARRQ
jgi:fibronectin-binding autotransporter adhesin